MLCAAAATTAAPLQSPLQKRAAEDGIPDGVMPWSAAAAVAESEGGDKGGFEAAVYSIVNETDFVAVDDPSLQLVKFTEKQLSACQLQAGQEVRLQRKALKVITALNDYMGDGSEDTEEEGQQQEELLLRVVQLRGFGATGEVYDVQVLEHVVTADAATAGQSPLTAAAALAGPLAGYMLSLKVCRAYSEIPEELQKRVYREDAAHYLFEMQCSMAKHHRLMSVLGDKFCSVMRSHMCGSICSGDGSRLPALLMDRASSVSLDYKLLQPSEMSGRRRGVQGLDKRVVHRVMNSALHTLCVMHENGWAYLDLKPANIVACYLAKKGQPSSARMEYNLVNFGSSQHLGTASSRTITNVPGTPAYMSPEWAQGCKLSYQADIWALGNLLFELQAGRAPHSELEGLRAADTHDATLQDMQKSAKYKTLTKTEWAFIGRCLAHNPEQRPTAEQLQDDMYIVFGPG